MCVPTLAFIGSFDTSFHGTCVYTHLGFSKEQNNVLTIQMSYSKFYKIYDDI